MSSNLKFYRDKNDKSKFIVSNGDLQKEGDYIELKANSVDASFEKHVPVCKVEDGKVTVTVGSSIHPMLDEHYIMWIAIVHDDNVKMIKLKPNDQPIVVFDYLGESEVYAFCNLHGLWKNNV